MVGPLRHLALCLLLLLPFGARAETIGPAQAEALQQQLKAWLGGLLGPSIALPDLPLRFTGEGDHYQATAPIPGLVVPTGDAAVTAAVRPLDGGRWAIDDMRLPAASSFTMILPDNGDKGTGGPAKVDIQIGKQASKAVIDPSLTTASTMQVDIRGINVVSESPKQHQEQKIDVYGAQSSLKPTADGKLDLDMDATMEGWRSASRTDGGTTVAVAARRFHASANIGGISREQVNATIAVMTGFLTALPARIAEKGGKSELSPAERAQLRKLIAAMDGIVQSVRLEESLDGLKVDVGGMGGVTVQHFLLGFGGEAPKGRLHAWFDVGMDGLDTPSLPPKVTAYLPRHIAFRPSLSGVQTADLAKLATDASADDPDDKQLGADIDAIFAHGGVDFAVETLAFDVGPAKLEAKGLLKLLSADSWHGEARVIASGLDELTDQARSRPELKEALPVLIMLRGLAKPDGKRLVWDIASDTGTVTVNGVDLSQLGGDQSKPKPKPPGQPQKR